MLFTEKIFHLQYFFSFSLRLLFQIKSQPVDAYKNFAYLKKHKFCFVVF